MKNFRATRLRALPLLLAVFGVGGALSFAVAPHAPAQVTPAIPTTVGVVDEELLASSFKEYQNAIAALDKRAQSLDERIPAREYLSEQEAKNFDTLIVLPAPTSAQQSQLEALVKIGNDRKAEYYSLVGNATRTPDNNKRLKELQDIAAKNASGVQTIAANLLEAIRKQQDEVDKTYTDRAQSVVITIAGEKKLVAVLRKKALVWSADNVDITAEVLKRLNGGK